MYLKQSHHIAPSISALIWCTIRLLGVVSHHLTPLTLSQVQDSYKASKESQYRCIPFIHQDILHPFLNYRIYFRQGINKMNLKLRKI